MKNNINSQLSHVPAMRSGTALDLVQSSRFVKRLASALIIGLFVAVFAMLLLPWQQTSKGIGKVVAYVPQERQQTIQAPTKGVVARIGPGLVEGSIVKKGDFLLEVQPFAPDMIAQLEGQMTELNTKLETTNVKIDAYTRNIEGFTEARDFAVQMVSQQIESAKSKLKSKQRLIPAYEAKELQARINYDRQDRLNQAGIKATREVEVLKKNWDVTQAELDSIHEEIESLQLDLEAKKSQLNEKRELAQTKIDYAKALQQDAKGNAATVRKEMRELELKLSETKRFEVTAPRAGTIFRMPVYELGQTVKQGDSLITIVPETTQLAVEIFVKVNDIPLIETDQDVRIQFEGWPGVQIPGWPSLALNVFDGRVVTVDATDDGKGHFRVLVLPTDETTKWPTNRFLRQGVRANGWVQMRRVSLGYEIWRQLNGFPIITDTPKTETKEPKPPKIPK